VGGVPIRLQHIVRDIRRKDGGGVVGVVLFQMHSRHIGRDITIERHGGVVQLGECFVWPIKWDTIAIGKDQVMRYTQFTREVLNTFDNRIRDGKFIKLVSLDDHATDEAKEVVGAQIAGQP
jgi:hypothetical protein